MKTITTARFGNRMTPQEAMRDTARNLQGKGVSINQQQEPKEAKKDSKSDDKQERNANYFEQLARNPPSKVATVQQEPITNDDGKIPPSQGTTVQQPAQEPTATGDRTMDLGGGRRKVSSRRKTKKYRKSNKKSKKKKKKSKRKKKTKKSRN
jgi:hypothetical protein